MKAVTNALTIVLAVLLTIKTGYVEIDLQYATAFVLMGMPEDVLDSIIIKGENGCYEIVVWRNPNILRPVARNLSMDPDVPGNGWACIAPQPLPK